MYKGIIKFSDDNSPEWVQDQKLTINIFFNGFVHGGRPLPPGLIYRRVGKGHAAMCH